MPDAHRNFSVSSVATAPSPATSGTSLVLTAGHGVARFNHAPPYNAVVHPAGADPTPDNAEVVRVTNRSTDTLTIARAQEGSTARSIVVGDVIYAAMTAKSFTDIEPLNVFQVDAGESIQTAVTAAEAVSGGATVQVGPGSFVENVTIVGDDITLKGSGNATKIAPTSGIGLLINNADRAIVRSLKIGGTPATGMKVAGSSRGKFSDLQIENATGSGLLVDGDQATEQHYDQINIRDCLVGFDYQRTTTADTGGIYLNQIIVTRGTATTGSCGFRFASTHASRSDVFLFADTLIADNCERGLDLNQVQKLHMSKLWVVGSGEFGGQIEAFQTWQFFLDDAVIYNSHAAGSAISPVSCVNWWLSHLQLSGPGVAFDNGACANIHMDLCTNECSGGLASDLTNLGYKTIHPYIGAHRVLLNGGGGSAEAWALEDASSGRKIYMRVNASNGQLEIVNSAFDAIIWKLAPDGSSIEFAGGIKVIRGSGTPEGAVTAPVGSQFLRSDGGAGTSLYVKQSGSGNSGWAGK